MKGTGATGVGARVLVWAALLAASRVAVEGAEVPMRILRTRHALVDVMINGTGPWPMLLDTGSPLVVVSERVARAARLERRAARGPMGLALGPGVQTRIDSAEVGGAIARGIPGYIFDHPAVEVLTRQLSPVEGILGFPFFARFRMTLDYARSVVTLEPGTVEPPDPMRTLEASLDEISGGRDPGPRVLAPAALWGIRVQKDTQDAAPGVEVVEVSPGGAAWDAGLRPGDRLLTMDGRWTDSLADVYTAASLIPPGRPITVVIGRGLARTSLSVLPRAGL